MVMEMHAFALIEFECDDTLAVVQTTTIQNFDILSPMKVGSSCIVTWKAKQKGKAERYSAKVLQYGGKWWIINVFVCNVNDYLKINFLAIIIILFISCSRSNSVRMHGHQRFATGNLLFCERVIKNLQTNLLR